MGGLAVASAMNGRRDHEVEARVELQHGAVVVTVVDSRPELRAQLEGMPAAQMKALASEAWRVGHRAIQSALIEARESRLDTIGSELRETLHDQIETQTSAFLQKVLGVFTEYFDPNQGRIAERLERFAKDDGEVAMTIRRLIEPENSALAQTLALNVGAASPLFKMLSPTDSQGVVMQLQHQVKMVLDQSQTSLADAMNPRVEGSPVHMFLADLQRALKEAEGSRTDQLKALTAQLDANDENSLLSQLVRKTTLAQQELQRAINPELPNSPMAVVLTSIRTALKEANAEHKTILEAMSENQRTFHEEMRAAIQRIETQQEAMQQGLLGGHTFEDALGHFVIETLKVGPALTVDRTGAKVGEIRGCKVGDLVVRYTDQSAFEGAGIVIEAKHDKSYTVQTARAEMERARNNRDCQIGLFVLATTHAPPGFPSIERYGNDVLMTWNPQDMMAAARLHAALLLTLGLATRQRSDARGNISAIADLEAALMHEYKRLEKVQNWATTITANSENIVKHTTIAQKKFLKMVENTRETLLALKVEAQSFEAECDTPLGLAHVSLERAQDAIALMAPTTEVTVELPEPEGVAMALSADETAEDPL